MSEAVKNKKQRSIVVTLRRYITGVLLITLFASITVASAGFFIVQSNSEDLLIEQTIEGAELYAEGRADTFNQQLESVVSMLESLRDSTEYLYAHPEEFTTEELKIPADFPEDTTGLTMHWVPFLEEDLDNPEVVAEANLLSAMRPTLDAFYHNCPMLVTCYYATETHVNIGYDENVLDKVGIFYNPKALEAEWYINTIQNDELYISDTYTDVFGRGLNVTIAIPYHVNGEVRGVIGIDLNLENIQQTIEELEPTNGGYAVMLSAKGEPIAARDMDSDTSTMELLGKNYAGIQDEMVANTGNYGYSTSVLNNEDVYVTYSRVKLTGWQLALILPVNAILAPAETANHMIWQIIIFLWILALVIMAVMAFFARKLAKKISAPIVELTSDAEKIGAGELEYTTQIHTGNEIETLAHSFESMTASLRDYITNLTAVTAEKERIGAELDVATRIQASMLPNVFPDYTDQPEFSISALMHPAKEVGGDFFDFFRVDENHLAIVVADVSGKGIPAALFMVIGKTLIKDHTLPGVDLGTVFSEVNNLLCEANSEELFITAFEGVLDLRTGDMVFVNAGHEMPFVTRQGKYTPQQMRAGFVLAGMEDMRFRGGSIHLEPGDRLFQYTDGVTEATNAHNELYGMERLEAALNMDAGAKPEDIIKTVKEDIDKFVGEAPQFDDITMLCLEYKKPSGKDDEE